MPTAFSYIRFSSPDQARGDSLRRQLQGSLQWADQNGYELDTTLRDLGVSAYRGANESEGALKAFIDNIEQGRVPPGSVLIIESLDRLSRQQVLKSLTLFTRILSTGIKIVTLVDGHEYTERSLDDIGNLMLSLVIMSRAHEESAIKSRRISAAWDSKRKFAHEKPVTSRLPAWLTLNRSTNAIEIIDERADIVREIFRKSAAGIGKRVIVRQLNEHGILPWGKGQGWHESYIQKILNNRAVLGEFQPYTSIGGSKRQPIGEAILGYFPQVVTPDLFYQSASAKRGRRQAGGRRGKTFANLLTGLCVCSDCGSPMRYVNKGAPPRGGQYLVCSNSIRGLGCNSTKNFRYDDVEKILLMELSSHIDWYSPVVENKVELNEIYVRKEALGEQLKQIDEKLGRYLDLFESAADVDLAEARSRYISLGEDRTKLKHTLAALNQEIEEYSSDLTGRQSHRLTAALFALRSKIDEDKRYEARVAANASLRRLLSRVFFSSADGVKVGVILRSGKAIVLAITDEIFEMKAALYRSQENNKFVFASKENLRHLSVRLKKVQSIQLELEREIASYDLTSSELGSV